MLWLATDPQADHYQRQTIAAQPLARKLGLSAG